MAADNEDSWEKSVTSKWGLAIVAKAKALKWQVFSHLSVLPVYDTTGERTWMEELYLCLCKLMDTDHYDE